MSQNNFKVYPRKVLGEGGKNGEVSRTVLKSWHGLFGKCAVKISPITKNNNGFHEYYVGRIASSGDIDGQFVAKTLGQAIISDFDEVLKILRIKKPRPRKRRNGNKGSNAEITKLHLLFIEYCNGGSLQSWLMERKPNIPKTLENVELFYGQILEAVGFLHSIRLIHGDLKPQNILLHSTVMGTKIKIVDFGESIFEYQDGKLPQGCTALYKDPAFAEDDRKTRAYDVYSLGLIFVILLSSSFLDFDDQMFPTKCILQNALHKILSSVKGQYSGWKSFMNGGYKSRTALIEKMLIPVSTQRPEVSTLTSEFNQTKGTDNFHPDSFKVPPKCILFSGRRKFFNVIATHLSAPGRKRILIHGISGTGKRTLAAEICHNFRESEKYQRILWLQAYSRNKIWQEFQKLRKLKVVPSNDDLLVLEDVNNFCEIEYLIPKDASIIATSRFNEESWPQDFVTLNKKLNPISAKNSVTLIKKQMDFFNYDHNTVEKEQLETLAEKVGYLCGPLVINVAYICNRGISIQKYFRELVGVPEQLHSYYNIILRSAKEVKRRNKSAYNWLLVCSFLEKEAIPEAFLDGYLESEKTEKSQIISVLKSFSLMDFDESTGMFSLPKAVQEAMRQTRNSGIWKPLKKFKKVVQTFFGKNDKLVKVSFHQLLPHVQTFCKHAESDPAIKIAKSKSFCLESPCLSTHDPTRESLIVYLYLLHLQRKCHTALGASKASEKLCRQIAPIRKQLFGSDSVKFGESLMLSGRNMLRIALSTPQRTTALPLFRERLHQATTEFEEALLAIPDTENHHANKIACLMQIGKCHISSLLRESFFVEISRRKYTEDDIEAANVRWKKGMENYRKALEKLAVYEKFTKQHFVDFKTCFYQMALLHKVKGEYFGEESCLILSLISIALFDNDNLDGENGFYTSQIRKKINQLRNPESEKPLYPTKLNPNCWTSTRGDAETTVTTLIKFYKRLKPWTQEQHEFYKCLRGYSQKFTILNQAKAASIQRIPLYPISVVTNKVSVFRETLKKGEPKGKLPKHIESMREGALSKVNGRLHKAIEKYEEALPQLLKDKTADPIQLANTYIQIAESYKPLGNNEKVLEAYKMAYHIRKNADPLIGKVNTTEFAEIAISFAKFSTNFGKKLSLYEEAIRIVEECKDGNYQNRLGMIYQTRARIQLLLKEYTNAKESFDKALEFFKLGGIKKGNDTVVCCIKEILKLHKNGTLIIPMEIYEQKLKDEMLPEGVEYERKGKTKKNHAVKKRRQGRIQVELSQLQTSSATD